MTVLRRRYCQIFGPSRHLAKLSDSLCRYFDVRIDLDRHLSRQATESYVKRSTALGLISHEGSPYPGFQLREANYNLSTLLAIGQTRVPIPFDAIRRPLFAPQGGRIVPIGDIAALAIAIPDVVDLERSSSAFNS
jgi:hypothetical protein